MKNKIQFDNNNSQQKYQILGINFKTNVLCCDALIGYKTFTSSRFDECNRISCAVEMSRLTLNEFHYGNTECHRTGSHGTVSSFVNNN